MKQKLEKATINIDIIVDVQMLESYRRNKSQTLQDLLLQEFGWIEGSGIIVSKINEMTE